MPATPLSRISPRLIAAVILAALCLTVLFQWHGDAYAAGWSADPDESGHYVTGLMVRDYITSGFRMAPMPFAVDYYEHYPRVALGHWPPFFYIVQAGWTLVFGVSTKSLLTLVAALTALLAALTFWLIARAYPAWLAACFTLIFLTAPMTLEYGRMLMSDGLVALLVLAGLARYERYLDEPGWRHSIWFGVFASAAILTKGTGIVLAPIPLLAVVFLQRLALLRRVDFWLPAGIVAVLCGPWYVLIRGSMHEIVHPGTQVFLRRDRIPETISELSRALPLVWIILGLVGVAIFASRLRRKEASTWAMLGLALLLSMVGFRVTIRPWGVRHVFILLPIFCYCAAAGTFWAYSRLARYRRAVAMLFLIAALAGSTLEVLNFDRKPRTGVPEAARGLLSQAGIGANEVILVVAEPYIESMFVASVAEIDERPGRFVRRGWKRLTTPKRPMSLAYRPNFATATQWMNHLNDNGTFILALEDLPQEFPHVSFARQAIREFPASWRYLGILNPDPEPHERRFLAYRFQREELAR
jgi:hypothetical protein